MLSKMKRTKRLLISSALFILLFALAAIPQSVHAADCLTCGPLPLPQDYIGSALTKVQEWVGAGSLNTGQGSSLEVKLNSALANLDTDPTTSVSQLQAFIYQVQAFVRAGLLTQAEAQPLIDDASHAIYELTH